MLNWDLGLSVKTKDVENCQGTMNTLGLKIIVYWSVKLIWKQTKKGGQRIT